MDKKGRVKIADFGLAKVLGVKRERFTLTATEQVMGTPQYMAPEQLKASHAVDHRADIYSLGVVFYEMLTGELPVGKFQLPSSKAHIAAKRRHLVVPSQLVPGDHPHGRVSTMDRATVTRGSQPISSRRRTGLLPFRV